MAAAAGGAANNARGVGDAAPYGWGVRGRQIAGATGGRWRPVAAATGDAANNARGVGDAAPYGRVMFSNGNLKTPQFSILNAQFSIAKRAAALKQQPFLA